jgi:hypothetical protein
LKRAVRVSPFVNFSVKSRHVPLHASENFTGTPLPAFVTLTVRSADRRSREVESGE